MLQKMFRTTALTLGLAAMTLSAGVSYAQPGPGDGGPPPGQGDNGPPPDQGDNGPPPGGQYNTPPPEGYNQGDDQDDQTPEARDQDEHYSYAAEQWAARNCVRAHQNDVAAGVVIGGILGAVIGSNLSGRHSRGAGAFVGGATGAVAGGAIASSAANSDPNCPPGYGLRPGAAHFYAGPIYGPDVYYAAPGWYDPWIWYGNHWIYRPYPYHRYWYRHHHH